MTLISASAAAASAAAPLPLGSNPEPAGAIFAAAGLLLPHLERGERVDAAALRAAMETAFGASDATGAWDWKTAYDACEAATVLFLRKYGKALFRKAGSPAARLSALSKIAGLLPTHTRRSEESQTFQQFSTPIPLGLVALTPRQSPRPTACWSRPPAPAFAILAEIAGGALVLNELADTRADLLTFSSRPFPSPLRRGPDRRSPRSRRRAQRRADEPAILGDGQCRRPHCRRRISPCRLGAGASRPGGRLVAITGANFAPDNLAWRDAFVRLQERGRIVFRRDRRLGLCQARHDHRPG
jgi:hypothetical protein